LVTLAVMWAMAGTVGYTRLWPAQWAIPGYGRHSGPYPALAGTVGHTLL